MSMGLSIEEQARAYRARYFSQPTEPAVSPRDSAGVGTLAEQARAYRDAYFSQSGPAAGFTEPSAATRLDQPRTPATAGDKQFRAASQQVAQKVLGTSDQLTTGERHAQSLFTGIMSGVGDVAGLGVRALQTVGVDTGISSHQFCLRS